MLKKIDFSPKAETRKEVPGKAGGWQVRLLGKAQAMQAKGSVNSPASAHYKSSKTRFFPLKKKS